MIPVWSDDPMSKFHATARSRCLPLARKRPTVSTTIFGTEALLWADSSWAGRAVNVIQKMGLELETVRMEVEKRSGTGPDQKMVGNIPTRACQKSASRSPPKEAKALNHTLRRHRTPFSSACARGDGVAAKVLKNLDVDIEHAARNLEELASIFFRSRRILHSAEGARAKKLFS